MAKMALTANGNFYARFFIEQGSPSLPPIPSPVDSMSFDTFEYYVSSEPLNGLNSGSNEWNNTTPLAAWSARLAYKGVKEWDEFTSYTAGSSLSGSLAGSGSGAWSGVYDYYARIAFVGLKNYDLMTDYVATTPISGSGSGVLWNDTPWVTKWNGRSVWSGIKAYDDVAGYTTGNSSFTASNYQPDQRYQSFTEAWKGRTVVTS